MVLSIFSEYRTEVLKQGYSIAEDIVILTQAPMVVQYASNEPGSFFKMTKKKL